MCRLQHGSHAWQSLTAGNVTQLLCTSHMNACLAVFTETFHLLGVLRCEGEDGADESTASQAHQQPPQNGLGHPCSHHMALKGSCVFPLQAICSRPSMLQCCLALLKPQHGISGGKRIGTRSWLQSCLMPLQHQVSPCRALI